MGYLHLYCRWFPSYKPPFVGGVSIATLHLIARGYTQTIQRQWVNDLSASEETVAGQWSNFLDVISPISITVADVSSNLGDWPIENRQLKKNMWLFQTFFVYFMLGCHVPSDPGIQSDVHLCTRNPNSLGSVESSVHRHDAGAEWTQPACLAGHCGFRHGRWHFWIPNNLHS